MCDAYSGTCATPATVVPKPVSELPYSGGPLETIGALALGALIMGAILVLLFRKRI